MSKNDKLYSSLYTRELALKKGSSTDSLNETFKVSRGRAKDSVENL
jgi:hypothetical protein